MSPGVKVALKLVNGDGRSETRPVGDRALVVGRSPDAHWRFADRLMSRQHARFACRDGHLVVEDLDSRLGTVINGRRVPARLPVQLRPGDRVFVGCVALEVVALGAPEGIAPGRVSRFVPRLGVAYADQPTVRFGSRRPALDASLGIE